MTRWLTFKVTHHLAIALWASVAMAAPPTPVALPGRAPTAAAIVRRLPATGQVTQVFAGDDGGVRAGAPLRYVDNGDGTITDSGTGLMWEKKVGLDANRDPANLHDADNCYSWQGACLNDGAGCRTDADCGSKDRCECDDCQTAWPNGLTIFEWVARLNSERFAGHDDWRVPDVKELLSIVDYSTVKPAAAPAFNGAHSSSCSTPADPTCSGTRSGHYWSSTALAPGTDGAWAVDFANGIVLYQVKQEPNQVRAVRGDGVKAGAPSTYVDNGDGTITDRRSGLMWEKKVKLDSSRNPVDLHDADNCYPWQGHCAKGAATCATDRDCGANGPCNAVDCQAAGAKGLTIFKWVAQLNAAKFAGHNDWRLPNAKELQSLVDYSAVNPSIAPAFHGARCGMCGNLADPACGCTQAHDYWSSTTYALPRVLDAAWVVFFANGPVVFNAKHSTYFVRAVRGGM